MAASHHNINRLHERKLRVLLNDKSSTVDDMLSVRNDATIHAKDIQKLMIELVKYLYGLSTQIMKEASIKRILKYNVRSCTLRMRYKNLSSLDLFISIIKIGIVVTLPTISVKSDCWWCRFCKLKLRAIVKRCTYQSINIVAVFEFSQENICCCEISLKIKSPTLSEKKTHVDCFSAKVWNVSKVRLKKSH